MQPQLERAPVLAPEEIFHRTAKRDPEQLEARSYLQRELTMGSETSRQRGHSRKVGLASLF